MCVLIELLLSYDVTTNSQSRGDKVHEQINVVNLNFLQRRTSECESSGIR